MIGVTEARELLKSRVPLPRLVKMDLRNAAGYVLAEDVLAVCNVPQFNNSAMDGYAFQFDSWKGEPLLVQGESAAGKPYEGPVLSGMAIRIFTGAAVPEGTDTVVMQEKVDIIENKIIVNDTGLQKGNNIRLQSSQNKLGDLILKKDSYLNAACLGFLAGCGVSEVLVYDKPKISVIVTGDEIVNPGTKLGPGEVYECNSYSLFGALQEIGLSAQLFVCKDSTLEIEKSIATAFESCDFLLISGGVSVGDYDFVIPALNQGGVQTIFHGVKQKPAKPLYAGCLNGKLVFGLPGNPASVLTSFYVYVLPLLLQFMGKRTNVTTGILSSNLSRKAGLTQFYKAKLIGNDVSILEGQESYRMDAFAQTNCLVEVSENVTNINAGESVNLILFN